MQVAVVGCGGIGRAHARAYAGLAGVRVAACVDRDVTRARQVAEEFAATPLDSLDGLPADVELVSVTTDPASHFSVAAAALRSGRHVMCEKPLALTTREARLLVAMAQDAGRHLSVGFKMRYEPCFLRARELVSALGPIVAISTTKMQPFVPRPGDWRPEVGAMFELSVHDFDLIHFVTGLQPLRVAAATLSRRLGWQREDGFAAIAGYEQGAVATLAGSYTLHSHWQGRDFALTITGERGYLRILRGDQLILHTDEYLIEPAAPAGDTFARELAGFCDAVAAGHAPPISPHCGVTSTGLVEAIWRAGLEGREIALAEL